MRKTGFRKQERDYENGKRDSERQTDATVPRFNSPAELATENGNEISKNGKMDSENGKRDFGKTGFGKTGIRKNGIQKNERPDRAGQGAGLWAGQVPNKE